MSYPAPENCRFMSHIAAIHYPLLAPALSLPLHFHRMNNSTTPPSFDDSDLGVPYWFPPVVAVAACFLSGITRYVSNMHCVRVF
jgi:hypothetical protein